MLKRILLCAPLLAVVAAAPLQAQTNSTTNDSVDFAEALAGSATGPSPALLAQISKWLVANFDLTPAPEHPRVAIVSPARMAAVRFRGLASDRQVHLAAEAGRSAPPEFGLDVYALYDDLSRVIYLHENWTGASPADVSLLVHEMVHHLQNAASEKFRCPHAREKDAYRAQRKWLAQFGRNLEDEFEIDSMTVLVRSNCLE
jgi:hypothetical protein